MLTKDLIKHQSGEYDIEVVQYLKLPGIALPSITTIMLSMTNLLELDLSHNEIKKVDNLTSLTKLRRLDLSSNMVTSLSEGWCSNLKCLSFLSLHGNKISDVDDIYTLTPLSGTLRTLYLRLSDDTGDSSNPCCSHPAYHNKVTSAMIDGPGLVVLDGESCQLNGEIEKFTGGGKDPFSVEPSEEFSKDLPIENWVEAPTSLENRCVWFGAD